jgi:hypothetical protein
VNGRFKGLNLIKANCAVRQSGDGNGFGADGKDFSPGFERKTAVSGTRKTYVREFAPGGADGVETIEISMNI